MRRWRNTIQMTRRIKELEKALVYSGESPFYIDDLILQISKNAGGRRRRRIHRRARAYFAWRGLTVIPVAAPGMNERWEAFAYVGHEGRQYPLRPFTCDFETYEIAVVLVRDGYEIDDAFETARLLQK